MEALKAATFINSYSTIYVCIHKIHKYSYRLCSTSTLIHIPSIQLESHD